MKLPRFAMACMASVILSLIVATIVWCWLQWPSQTAGSLITLIEAGRWTDASAKLANGADDTVFETLSENAGWAKGGLTSTPRTWSDRLIARQEFSSGLYCFTVERGCVVQHRLIVFVSYTEP